MLNNDTCPSFFFVLFICLLVTGSCSVAQGGLKFLGSFDCPAPVSWVAGTTGASHYRLTLFVLTLEPFTAK
uniref:Secreted protein n=1 Tax=Mus spicilegus TaxID=10103 RepID=A0A8C6MXZ1_MUSSI